MNYIWNYKTPEGFSDIGMSSDGEFLTGLWFQKSKDENKHISGIEEEIAVFKDTKKWLDIYFSGKNPDFTPAYKILNLTPFRKEVIEQMNQIPYGKVISYGDIAHNIAQKRGLKRMSAQAVGQAVGWNPICIIVPCHRVVGTSGSLTGYGGGISNKISLLKIEGWDMDQFIIPTKGSAL